MNTPNAVAAPAKEVRPFHTVLVANRGEIAVRVTRTLRRMGYRVVAVYSDADRDLPHVMAADVAVRIGAAPPRESYLDVEAILRAARRAGADAVHPGYGFLAENAEFADAVDAAGMVFIGPSGAAIRAMGNKAEAKRLMLAADMPCVPGYQSEDQDDAVFLAAARDIGFPVMVKAAAGGGGRGMRLVHDAAALPGALASARSEAQAAFGSDELILERAILRPRHVEIQVLADAHGHVIHLGERDCSVQRRHQKVIEEAPSPVVDAELRQRMGEAAVRSARAIGYVGAGTMEFLLDTKGRFYFMEMNTRLQVEHAVTEAVTGLDLVEWQARIAAGERLTLAQEDVRLEGHAIEVRLTAEDVPAGFLPQTGDILRWQPPEPGRDVRVDHALRDAMTVSPYYDSMLAKLVAHGRDRDEARRKLLGAVRATGVLGLPTNQAFLAQCLADPVFAAGTEVHTGFIEERFGVALAQRERPAPQAVAVAAFVALAPAGEAGAPALGGMPSRVSLALDDARWEVVLRRTDAAWAATVCALDDAGEPVVVALADPIWRDGELSIVCDGMRESLAYARQDERLYAFQDGQARAWTLPSAHRRREEAGGDGAVHAPLTGRIVSIALETGSEVEAGMPILVMEAMKMEHTLTAPVSGRLVELNASAGGQASKGALLARIEPQAQ